MSQQITQSHIDAGRDNAGGDINNVNSNNTNFVLQLNGDASPIASWMAQLAEEINNNAQIMHFIDTLQMYQERHSHDGIDGLEEKLKHSGRLSDLCLAVRKKELFTRLLTKYAMFDSAQQIFAYLLSKLEADFRAYVLPNISSKSPQEVDAIFHQYLITPCANEIKTGVFCLNPAIAAGMVYWLAEQCYIRWHQ